MRRRDIRALAFCAITIPVVFWAAAQVLNGWLAPAALCAAYAVWLFTRPRMIRVVRRLRGDRSYDWGDYFQD